MMRFLVTALICSISFSLQAQRYKDIYPQVAGASSDEEALSLIKTYMIEDLDHPNSNFRLALIYERRYQNSDPLTQYERAIANAEESALRYLKSMALVDEREVKKNTGWYANFSTSFDSKGRPIVEYQTVQNKIKNGYDSAKLLVEKLPNIYETFTESVDYYDQAIKLFAEINGSYTSMDKLLLLYDENLGKKLETLKVKYDSSLYYLDQYIGLIKEYNVGGYNQTYTVKPINTYRLEGLLTSPNFLISNIEIWNYKEWANTVQKSVSGEITSLRQRLEQAEIKLNNDLELIENKSYNENFEPHLLDKKLEFDLRKFDNESLPIALLKYKEFKQDLLLKENTTQDFDSTQSESIKNAYYGDLIYLTLDADSLLKIVDRRINEESIQKYPGYLPKYYGSLQGLNTYVSQEKQIAANFLDKGVTNIRKSILGAVTETNNAPEFYSYRRLRIPSQAESVDIDSLDNSFHTTHKVESADGSKYLAGVVKSSRAPNPIKTFIIKVDERGRVNWYNEYEMIEEAQGNQANVLGDLVLTPEGCALAVYTFDQDTIVNNIIYLDENGQELFIKSLETKQFPRQGKYVEHNSSLLFSFKGTDGEQNQVAKETLEMISLNLIGDLRWNKTFDYSGGIEALVTTSEGYMVIGNFTSIRNNKGQEIVTRANANQTNAFAVRFSYLGQVQSVLTLKSPDNYVINRVIKINDSVINLMGFKDPSGKSVHCIVNQHNRVVFSNL